MDHYFTVPATATSLAAFDADGGLKSLGLVATARYDMNDDWALFGSVEYHRLRGDAARSPITQAGSHNQALARLSLVRKFSIRN